jgi:hypothetical protein
MFQKYNALFKKSQKHSLLIFWFRVKISKNEKSGIPKYPNRSFAESFIKIGGKKWSSALMG